MQANLQNNSTNCFLILGPRFCPACKIFTAKYLAVANDRWVLKAKNKWHWGMLKGRHSNFNTMTLECCFAYKKVRKRLTPFWKPCESQDKLLFVIAFLVLI